MNPPIVLALAGWDPAGHAGLAADLRTLEALGCTAMGVATAQTVQSSVGMALSQSESMIHKAKATPPLPSPPRGEGVAGALPGFSEMSQAPTSYGLDVVPTEVGLLRAQLAHLLADVTPGAVKVGMVGGIDQIAVMAELLSGADFGPMVLDPVLATSSGYELLSREGMTEMVRRLFPLAALVTPNLPEASALTGLSESTPKRDLAAAVLALGCRAVLLKGGHGIPPITDLVMTPDGAFEITGPNVVSPHMRGTGCRLSSAIAAHLAHGLDLEAACRSAKAWLTAGMTTPRIAGQGAGSPGIPLWDDHRLSAVHAERLAKLQGIYVITDTQIRPDRTHLQIASAAIEGGVCAVQLRDKWLSTPQLMQIAGEIADLCRRAGVLFLLNDRVDIAVAVDADGAHVGPDDLPPAEARRVLGPHRLLGVSTGTVDEAKEAAPVASYLGVGAIFGTQTKGDAGAAVGVGSVLEIRRTVPGVPIVAIGGIDAGNIVGVWESGVECAAVISAVVGAQDMVGAVRGLVESLPIRR